MSTVPWETIGRLAELFTRLDTERGIPAEQQWTLQVLKLTEEVGESAQAVIGAPAFFEALLARKAARFFDLDEDTSTPPREGA
ncbi:hypothetical protein ABT117_36265 [Streptomyces sp. NPDC002262]|uniref:hypothetical protein n=1 Tax=Streptomyces sp. NPDC002262 TaxID=3154414 RepID=UPI00331768F3